MNRAPSDTRDRQKGWSFWERLFQYFATLVLLAVFGLALFVFLSSDGWMRGFGDSEFIRQSTTIERTSHEQLLN